MSDLIVVASDFLAQASAYRASDIETSSDRPDSLPAVSTADIAKK